MFYVCENWHAHGHQAVVHRGDCGHCNEGQGLKTGTHPSRGKWLGPFSNINAAVAAAHATGGRVIRHRCV